MEIIHDLSGNRFYTVVDGCTAYVSYEAEDKKLSISHTIVPAEIGGRGIAAALVQTAYDYALAQGLTPAATCTYALAWLRRNSRYTEGE